jgi:hypothetical protein
MMLSVLLIAVLIVGAAPESVSHVMPDGHVTVPGVPDPEVCKTNRNNWFAESPENAIVMLPDTGRVTLCRLLPVSLNSSVAVAAPAGV